ncbi:hypothetical protein KCU95_g815, partial [Aureobasidium melanogenum]
MALLQLLQCLNNLAFYKVLCKTTPRTLQLCNGSDYNLHKEVFIITRQGHVLFKNLDCSQGFFNHEFLDQEFLGQEFLDQEFLDEEFRDQEFSSQELSSQEFSSQGFIVHEDIEFHREENLDRSSRTAPVPVPSIVKLSTKSSEASTTAAVSSVRTSTSSAVLSSSSKTSSRFASISSRSVSSSASLAPKKTSSQAVSSKTATSAGVPTTSTGSYCLAGLDLRSGVQIARASAYCSSLLRPVVTAVSTRTEVSSTTLPTVRSTLIVVSNSSVAETIALTRVETESAFVPITAQFTAIYTRNVSDYVETTNIGTVSVATITEFTTSTITPSAQSTVLANRDIDMSSTPEPEVWVGMPPAQIMQICGCIIGDVSLTASTIYKSTETQTRTATEWIDIDATSTQISAVTSFTTQTRTSTLRLNLTSTVSTATSNYTITNRWNATYTVSSDSFTTTTQQVTELATYSSIYVPSPTASDIPAVALSQPTAIVGDVNGAPYDVDDAAYNVSLPVNLTLYGQSSASVMVSSNGLFGLTKANEDFDNHPLPYSSNGFGDIVAFGLWDDLYIYQGTQQGIYYEVSGAAPRRQTTFEFYVSSYEDSTAYYHFLMKFAEDKPNIVTYQYLSVSDLGQSATVGVQDTALGQCVQFSYNQPIICPGMQITFDTTPGSNSYHIDTPGSCTAST